MLDTRIFAAQILVDKGDGEVAQLDRLLRVEQKLIKKIRVVGGDLKLVPPESCRLGGTLQHASPFGNELSSQ